MRVARLLVAVLASGLPFDVEAIEDIKLAVSEAVTNCVLHAPASKDIEIIATLGADRLCVRIRDRGVGAQPQVRDLGLLAENGRGLMLIRALMDELELRSYEGGGTEVVMTKRVPGG